MNPESARCCALTRYRLRSLVYRYDLTMTKTASGLIAFYVVLSKKLIEIRRRIAASLERQSGPSICAMFAAMPAATFFFAAGNGDGSVE